MQPNWSVNLSANLVRTVRINCNPSANVVQPICKSDATCNLSANLVRPACGAGATYLRTWCILRTQTKVYSGKSLKNNNNFVMQLDKQEEWNDFCQTHVETSELKTERDALQCEMNISLRACISSLI